MTERLARMERLVDQVTACNRCPLGALARCRVFGDGNVSSRIMLVGEAPGMEEDATGHPFVGTAGGILTSSLYDAGIDRGKIFIANAIKCHPPADQVRRTGNRKPTINEIELCRPFLIEQIKIIRPSMIVALGGSALNALTGVPMTVKITQLIGTATPHTFEDFTTQIVVTFHPSYIGYNAADTALRQRYVGLFKAVRDWTHT